MFGEVSHGGPLLWMDEWLIKGLASVSNVQFALLLFCQVRTQCSSSLWPFISSAMQKLLDCDNCEKWACWDLIIYLPDLRTVKNNDALYKLPSLECLVYCKANELWHSSLLIVLMPMKLVVVATRTLQLSTHFYNSSIDGTL